MPIIVRIMLDLTRRAHSPALVGKLSNLAICKRDGRGTPLRAEPFASEIAFTLHFGRCPE